MFDLKSNIFSISTSVLTFSIFIVVGGVDVAKRIIYDVWYDKKFYSQ